MKVSAFLNIKLVGSCPACGAIDDFKMFLNGSQCISKNHKGNHFVFYHLADLKVFKLQVVEGKSSIIFNLKEETLTIHFPDDHEATLPFFDMDTEIINIKTMKELLVFT